MRKFVKMGKDFTSYQKGVTYFFDTPRVGPNPADEIVRRGFGELVPDPSTKDPEPEIEEIEVQEEEPAKALGDVTDNLDRSELNERAKELGIPNYWTMKTTTLEAAIAEREDAE